MGVQFLLWTHNAILCHRSNSVQLHIPCVYVSVLKDKQVPSASTIACIASIGRQLAKLSSWVQPPTSNQQLLY